MSNISLRLPESLQAKARELAKRDGISIDEFISSAVAEKVSVFLAEEHREPRRAKGSRVKFERVQPMVKARDPEPGDELQGHRQGDPRRAPIRHSLDRESPKRAQRFER